VAMDVDPAGRDDPGDLCLPQQMPLSHTSDVRTIPLQVSAGWLNGLDANINRSLWDRDTVRRPSLLARWITIASAAKGTWIRDTSSAPR
jgi:hypothetical protein